jgi:hypothetical protein
VFDFKNYAIAVPASDPISLFLKSTLINDLLSAIEEKRFYIPVSELPKLFHSRDNVLRV